MNDDPLASRWQRLGGYLLDLLMVGLILYLVMRLTGTVEQLSRPAGLSIGQRLIWTAAGLVLYVALNGYLLAKEGQTLGKQLVGTRIVDLAGEVPSFGKLIFLRYTLFFLLPLIPILGPMIGLLDGLWIFGREKRCVHDVLAGTRVVTAEPGLAPAARRILQGAALVAVILVGLIIYRSSLIATGERLEAGNYQLAFLKWNADGADVYGLDVERDTVTQLTMNHQTFGMRWTPDGQEMILMNRRRYPSYALNVGSGEIKQLDGGSSTPGLNGWSPDGQQRVFVAQEEDDRDQEIYVAQADGSHKRRLVQNPGADRTPAWSPNGQQVAFSTVQEEGWSLSVVNADGTNLKQIAQSPTPFAPNIYTGLRWSPDGSKLLFITRTERGHIWGALYVIDANGQNLMNVGDVQNESHPRWSPDGRMIAFDQASSGCLFSLAEAEPECQSGIESPSWSPDGRYLAYIRGHTRGQPRHICVKLMVTDRERCFEETTARGHAPVWRP